MSGETRGILSRIVERLDRAGVPFMVTGSFASTYHGVPRTTNDIDIVIAPTEETLKAFLQDRPEQVGIATDDGEAAAPPIRGPGRRRKGRATIGVASGRSISRGCGCWWACGCAWPGTRPLPA